MGITILLHPPITILLLLTIILHRLTIVHRTIEDTVLDLPTIGDLILPLAHILPLDHIPPLEALALEDKDPDEDIAPVQRRRESKVKAKVRHQYSRRDKISHLQERMPQQDPRVWIEVRATPLSSSSSGSFPSDGPGRG